ncbi:MAG: hypothetical protein ACE366_19640 [Bradymonadia bacterium]
MRARPESSEEQTWGRRLLRYAVVALAALAIAQAIRTWQAGGREITMMYEVPAGVLSVKLLDEEGTPMRKVRFAAGAERRHTVTLPDGTYKARLERRAGEKLIRTETWFAVGEASSTVVIKP